MSADPQTVLVLGASGQDGSYLVEHLWDGGHRVVAAGRSLRATMPENWRLLGLPREIERHDLDYSDAAAVAELIRTVRPTSIHVLAGQSSVRSSFLYPADTIRSQILPIVNVLEAVHALKMDAHVVFASSTECFGRTDGVVDEDYPFRPMSPYAAAKSAGSMIVRTYRDSYGLRCSNAYLSNHESVLRSPDFLFGKVLAGLAAIRQGHADAVTTGSLAVEGDWGYAAEYVTALTRIAKLDQGTDLILATGHTIGLRVALESLFEAFGVNPRTHLIETTDGNGPSGDRREWDVSRARRDIGWSPEWRFPQLAKRLRDDWEWRAARRATQAS